MDGLTNDEGVVNMKRERNVEILVPFQAGSEIPPYLIDFIQNDPNFVPEIHCNNLEDAFMSIHTQDKIDLAHQSNYSAAFGKYKFSKSKGNNVLMNPY